MTDQKTQMREGFEAQRKAGMSVDWFTWQIAWHDALFTVHDIAGDTLARQPAAIDKQDVKACPECGGSLTTWKCLCEPIWPGYTAPLDKQASKPAAQQTLSDGAQFFACYLIDNCENEIVREESVQAWLGKMLASPRYHPAAPSVEQDWLGETDVQRGEYDERSNIDRAIAAFHEVHPLAGNEPYDWPAHFIKQVRKALAEAMNAASTSANVAQEQPPTISRDFLGQIVREAWVKWAKQQPSPKPSWLAPYVELSETDRNMLRPAFAALHGSQAIRIPDTVVALIRRLDATLPKSEAA